MLLKSVQNNKKLYIAEQDFLASVKLNEKSSNSSEVKLSESQKAKLAKKIEDMTPCVTDVLDMAVAIRNDEPAGPYKSMFENFVKRLRQTIGAFLLVTDDYFTRGQKDVVYLFLRDASIALRFVLSTLKSIPDNKLQSEQAFEYKKQIIENLEDVSPVLESLVLKLKD